MGGLEKSRERRLVDKQPYNFAYPVRNEISQWLAHIEGFCRPRSQLESYGGVKSMAAPLRPFSSTLGKMNPAIALPFVFPAFSSANGVGLYRVQLQLPCLYKVRIQKIVLRVDCRHGDGAVEEKPSSATIEPKWKQKLAAADDHAEKTRQLTLLVQEEYKLKQAALRRQQSNVEGDVIPLSNLEFLPYLNEEGLITNCSRPDAKACVYAIFDNDKVLQFIGISRQVYMSMRLHFARMPSKCYFVKTQNITRPSRSLLELIKDKWMDENGSPPDGNDNGPQQHAWENPLDCKPLMTEAEIRKHEDAGPGPPKSKVLKNVARRIEAQLEDCYRERNCKERLRFDPKLKEKGLLDLKNT